MTRSTSRLTRRLAGVTTASLLTLGVLAPTASAVSASEASPSAGSGTTVQQNCAPGYEGTLDGAFAECLGGIEVLLANQAVILRGADQTAAMDAWISAGTEATLVITQQGANGELVQRWTFVDASVAYVSDDPTRVGIVFSEVIYEAG